MNNKGFTLIEVLSVVVILSMVILIVTTNGFGLFNKAKDKITEEQYKIIEEAANVLMVDVKHCSDELEEYNNLKDYFVSLGSVSSCYNLQESVIGKTVNFELLKRDYLDNNDLENINKNDFSIRVIDDLKIQIYRK